MAATFIITKSEHCKCLWVRSELSHWAPMHASVHELRKMDKRIMWYIFTMITITVNEQWNEGISEVDSKNIFYTVGSKLII